MKLSRKQFQQWGKQGAKKRAKQLSPARRKEIARQAATARWKKERGKGK